MHWTTKPKRLAIFQVMQWVGLLHQHFIIFICVSVVTLGFISSALVCFIALWIPSRSSALVTVYASLYTLLSAYVLAMAAMSPTPLLYKSKFGSVIIVSCYCLLVVVVVVVVVVFCCCFYFRFLGLGRQSCVHFTL